MNVELGVEVGGVGAVGSGQVEVVAQVLRGAVQSAGDHDLLVEELVTVDKDPDLKWCPKYSCN